MLACSKLNPVTRKQQLELWESSETNKEVAHPRTAERVKFPIDVQFFAACSLADTNEIKQLLAKGVDINVVNVDGLTALHQACIVNNYDVTKFLLEHGADVNIQDNEGWTPLHACASCPYPELTKLLLDHGADVGIASFDMELPIDVAQDKDTQTILREAMDKQKVDAAAARKAEEQQMLDDAKMWLKTGQYPTVIDSRTGATALHIAAAKDYSAVLEILLKLPGIDVDVVDNDGWTPLHAAAHWAQERPLRLLAVAGASFDRITLTNQSIFDVADRSVTMLLRQLREAQRQGGPQHPENADQSTVEAATPNRRRPGEPSEDADVQEPKKLHKDISPERRRPAEEKEITVTPTESKKDMDQADQKAKESEERKLVAELLASSETSTPMKGQESDGKRVLGGTMRKGDGTEEKPSQTATSTAPSPDSTSVNASNLSVIIIDSDIDSSSSASSPTGSGQQPDEPRKLSAHVASVKREHVSLSNADTLLGSSEASSETPSVLVASSAAPSQVTTQKEDPKTLTIFEPSESNARPTNPVSTELSKPTDTSLVEAVAPPSKSSDVAEPSVSALSAHARSTSGRKARATPAGASSRNCGAIKRVSAVLAPVKSEETEAQRSSKARMVRSTRRSTQGITNDVLEEAKRMSAATIAATNHTIPKPSSQQPTETNVSPSETPTTASVPRVELKGQVSSPSAAPSELQKEFTSAQPTVRTTTAVLRMTSPSVPSSSRATAQLASNHKNDEDLQKPDSAAETSTVSHTATTNITPSVNRGRKTRDRVCTGKVNTSDVLAAASLLEQSSAKTDDSSTIPRPTSRFLRSSVTSTGGPAGGVSNGDRPSPSPSRQISPSPSNGTLLRSGSSVASSPQPQERYTWRDKIDYRRLYEEERNEKERLKRVLEKTNRDLAALQSELARLRTSKSSLLGSYSGGIRDPSPASVWTV
uniref:Uncharacterized protein n=1 Tax=Schistocephalus solidus TaxID=70667 RepID=A0A0X3PAB3_SCHSO